MSIEIPSFLPNNYRVVDLVRGYVPWGSTSPVTIRAANPSRRFMLSWIGISNTADATITIKSASTVLWPFTVIANLPGTVQFPHGLTPGALNEALTIEASAGTGAVAYAVYELEAL